MRTIKIKPRLEAVESLPANVSQYQLSKEVKLAINNWLNSHEFRVIREMLLMALNSNNGLTRVVIQADNVLLWQLPWHLWDLFDRYPQVEIAFSPSKYELPHRIERQPRAKNKVRVLAILGNSEGIDLEADRQILEKIADTETTFLVEPDRKEINDRLWEQDWDILFFAGHSSTQEDTGRIFIKLIVRIA